MVRIRQFLIFQITIGRSIGVVYERPGAGGGGDVVVGQAVDGEVVDGGGAAGGGGLHHHGAVGVGVRVVLGAAGGAVGGVGGVRVFGGAGRDAPRGGAQAVAGGQVLGLGPAGPLDQRWVGVVVTVPPSPVVDTLQVTASSCTGTARTSRTSSAPVQGLRFRTLSPTLTWAMGLVDPSATTTGVSAVKHASTSACAGTVRVRLYERPTPLETC